MNILYRYLTWQITKVCLLTTFIFLFIGLLTRVVHYGDLFSNPAVSFYDVFLILLLIQPKIIVSIIPFTLFITCFVVYHGIIHANEHIAFYNTGRGNYSLIVPFFIFSLVILVIMFILSNKVIPDSYVKMSKIHEKIASNVSSTLIKPKEFLEAKDIILFINSADENNIAQGIVMFDKREEDTRNIIISNSGIISFNGANLSLKSKETYIKKYTKYSPFAFFSDFKEYYISMNVDKSSNQLNASQISYVNTKYLIEQLKNFHPSNAAALRELKERIGWPLFLIIIPLSIITSLFRYFHFARNRLSAVNIIKSGIIIFYTIVSGLFTGNMFNSYLWQFLLYYINIVLIFLFLLFMCKEKF